MSRIGMLAVALLPCFVSAADDDRKSAELKWAKGVAADFFDAAFNGKLEQAESLIDSSLKKAYAKEGETRLREWLNNSISIRGLHEPVFQSEEIAPDQDEASFKGTLKDKESTLQFSLRVVKDKESSKWRVCYFHFKGQQSKQ